jgi:preprotein translocase subunit SecA
MAMPVIKDFVENRGAKGRIMVPITDGKRVFNLGVDMMEAYNTGCKNIVKEWHKGVLLVTIDELWKEHLRELDELRQSVQNASYEQKDPLVIYKVESFHLFENMLNSLNSKALSALMRGQIYVPQRPPMSTATPSTASATLESERRRAAASDAEKAEAARKAVEEAEARLRAARAARPDIREAAPARANDYSQYKATKEGLPGENAQRAAAANAGAAANRRPEPIKAAPKVGRNDPCPCGSGKKYKNCCGKGL